LLAGGWIDLLGIEPDIISTYETSFEQ
jgi:hypothetical protein